MLRSHPYEIFLSIWLFTSIYLLMTVCVVHVTRKDTDDESNESFETHENIHDEIIPVEESPDTFVSTPSSSHQELLVQQSS
ncbi:Protein of unknown function [Cotesia congregata]|uniref:Uncharacterized protein n=1 Tax=Cotesia congregata TaxID=51543 RepID=A0A8J2E4G7_COTCN|nr:Protein of unknown function [Cotesia congregata]